MISGEGNSYYDMQHFSTPQRAAVLKAVHEATGLSPHSIRVEAVSQDGASAKVQLALWTEDGKATALKAALGSDSLGKATQAALNALAQSQKHKTVAALQFSNVRDMLQYDGKKKVLSSSMVLYGVDATKVIASPAFRSSLREVIAAKTGVAASAAADSHTSAAASDGASEKAAVLPRQRACPHRQPRGPLSWLRAALPDLSRDEAGCIKRSHLHLRGDLAGKDGAVAFHERRCCLVAATLDSEHEEGVVHGLPVLVPLDVPFRPGRS